MEDNLEINLEEIYWESHPSIHMLDILDGKHLTQVYLYHHGINHPLYNMFQNQPPNYHTRGYNTQPMSKTLIQVLTLEYSKRPLKLMVKQWRLTSSNCLVLLFRDNIFEWGENYVQNHPNYTFEELEQAFYKQFVIVKNDEEVYMQLCNI
jgi:hypothetical protein